MIELQNNSPVRVIPHKETGEIVSQSQNNPEYGYVQLRQDVTSINASGFLTSQPRHALIRGNYEDLKKVFASAKEGTTLKGKIVVSETLVPPYPGAEPKINPQTGEVLTKDGQPIYREGRYTLNMEEQDILIPHDREMSAPSTEMSVASVEESPFAEE